MPTTMKVKREKLKAQELRRSHGGYARFADNGKASDPRNGEDRRLTAPTLSKEDQRALTELLVAEFKGPITRCPVADLTHRDDVGRVGKGRRSRDTRTYGDFKRIKQGLTVGDFTYEPAGTLYVRT